MALQFKRERENFTLVSNSSPSGPWTNNWKVDQSHKRCSSQHLIQSSFIVQKTSILSECPKSVQCPCSIKCQKSVVRYPVGHAFVQSSMTWALSRACNRARCRRVWFSVSGMRRCMRVNASSGSASESLSYSDGDKDPRSAVMHRA